MSQQNMKIRKCDNKCDALAKEVSGRALVVLLEFLATCNKMEGERGTKKELWQAEF